MKLPDYHKAISLLIPRIEKVLSSDVTEEEKCVLIRYHIEKWRE